MWKNKKERISFVKEVLSQDGVSNYEAMLPDRFGKIHNVLLSASILELNNEKCILLTVNDISSQKVTEESLRIRNEQFKNSFSYAPIGMALADNNGNIIKTNPAVCKISGFSESELLGKNVRAFTHADDLNKTLDYMHKLFAGELDHYQWEKRYQHKNGHYFWANVDVSIVRDSGGKPLYLINQLQDITKRKITETALDNIAKGVSAATGKEFFYLLSKHLAQTLQVDYALISCLDDENPESIEINRSLWTRSTFANNGISYFGYTL